MQEERMHEREHMILSFVEDEHYRPMKIKEMAALMNVPKKHVQALTSLQALTPAQLSFDMQ